MVIQNHLSPKEYLSAMKRRMSGHFELGQERYTGFFLGRLFYVTHHAGYEWNRRITNEKSAALGYVKKAEDGCEVHSIRFRGMLCPLQFIPFYLIMLWYAIYLDQGIRLGSIILMTVLTVLVAISSGVIEIFTENGQFSMSCLLQLLRDPDFTQFPNNK